MSGSPKFPPLARRTGNCCAGEILNKQSEKTADEWMEIYLQDGNIAAEPYRTSVQAMAHPAVVANDTVVTIDDPRVGPMRTLAPLVDLKDTPGEPSGPAPDVGQHNAEWLAPLPPAPANVRPPRCGRRRRAGPSFVRRYRPGFGDHPGRALCRRFAGRPRRASHQDRCYRPAVG